MEKHEDNYTHNIKKDNELSLDRRGFMKTIVGAAGVFAVSTMPWGAIAASKLNNMEKKTYVKQKIVDVANLKVGQAVEFAYPGEHDTALLIRLAENSYKAYQNACPHLRCPVFWQAESKKLLCPCHHGQFAPESGQPVAGPPRRPLPEINVAMENGAIYALGVKPYET